jgi:peptidoglycan/xylan/chitin deacetylase (PgdA/CDA1 family)
MTDLKGVVVAASAALGLPRLFGPDGPAATVLATHKFFNENESRDHSIDRLRMQLEWLRSECRPIGVSDLLQNLAGGTVPDRAVVMTIDDAQLDAYEVVDEFRNFGVPLAMFVPVGWVARFEESDDLLVHVITAIEWYAGPDSKIELANGSKFELSAAKKAANIDRILSERELLSPHLEEMYSKVCALVGPMPPSTLCNWSELRELARDGVHIGAHSVSHVRISQMSPVRQRFEIFESKRVLEANVGPCTSFAYPYGTADTHDQCTLALVKDAGFSGAFTNHSDFVTSSSQNFALPRISLPDEPIPFYEFKARASGANIPLRKLREMVRNPFH